MVNIQNTLKQIVRIVLIEKELSEKYQNLISRFESAEICGNSNEMELISKEGEELDKVVESFVGSKVITMITAQSFIQPNFVNN